MDGIAILAGGKNVYLLQKRPQRFWGPPSRLFNVNRCSL